MSAPCKFCGVPIDHPAGHPICRDADRAYSAGSILGLDSGAKLILPDQAATIFVTSFHRVRARYLLPASDTARTFALVAAWYGPTAAITVGRNAQRGLRLIGQPLDLWPATLLVGQTFAVDVVNVADKPARFVAAVLCERQEP